MILQELLRLQTEHGYLPRADLARLARNLAVPLYRVHEVASFYPHFRVFESDVVEQVERTKLPKYEITVCRDMACRLRGSAQYLDRLQRVVEEHNAQAAQGELGTVCGVSCLGRCDRAPAVRIATTEHGHAHEASANGHAEHDHRPRALMGRSLAEVESTVRQVLAGKTTGLPDDTDAALQLQPSPDKWLINIYAKSPEERYAALRRYRDQLTPAGHERAVAALTAEREAIAAKIEHLKAIQKDQTAAGDPAEIAQIPAEIDKLQKSPPMLAKADKCYPHPITIALWNANLLGMGGAGGRAYKKWSEVIAASGEKKYVVCNGDESEPGTFKDRELFLRTPYLVVEGIILAGLLIGAERGYIYIRHEYEECIQAVRDEIEWARKQGYCGDGILGTALRFNVEVFVSPGGYVCGEQTALIEAIQDNRSEPRNRPPELQTNGLWGMPTILNNVETLAWVPAIVTQGAADGIWYAKQGKPDYKGARFFSVSGDVERPGVYEVPIGITLGELIEKHCGGMRGKSKLKAVAMSGPSGGFLPPKLAITSFRKKDALELIQKIMGRDAKEFDILKMPLDIPASRTLGLMVGAAIVVYGDGTDLVDQAVSCLEFYKAESCGKCVPCRIGSAKLVEIGKQLQDKSQRNAALARWNTEQDNAVGALAKTMSETAICSLGQVAPNPLQSLLSYFLDDVKS
ncbi:MAG: NAD(P)H-dependent oxidoreductase subunit E [Pirellulaceae bacterium]|nr:NAD(P)H-dependent oxidoreductase subunit E [Pirellulaceae bacterium]